MRRSLIITVILALVGSAAWASDAEEPVDPLQVVATLAEAVQVEGATWNQRWAAYKEAKPTLKDAESAWSGRNKRGEEVLTPEDRELARLWHKHLFDPELEVPAATLDAAKQAWLKRKVAGETAPEEDGQRTEKQKAEDREAWEEQIALANAWDAYLLGREKIADRLRRDDIVLTGWIMGFIGAILLWGGVAWHVRLASKSKGKRHPGPLEGDETWPLRPEDEAPP